MGMWKKRMERRKKLRKKIVDGINDIIIFFLCIIFYIPYVIFFDEGEEF